jgi:hypothetical protein
MRVILRPADGKDRRQMLFANAPQVGVHFGAKGAVLEKGLAILGGKYDVRVDLNQGLGHD